MSSDSPIASPTEGSTSPAADSKVSEAEWVQLAITTQHTAAAPLVCRGVRGATTVEANNGPAILEATRDLLERLIAANQIDPEDVASAWFTTTADVTAEYPAVAARQLGWTDSALMCSHEMAVPHGLPMCIRVLIHWNTTRRLSEIKHVYIRGAVSLRPDRSKSQPPQSDQPVVSSEPPASFASATSSALISSDSSDSPNRPS